MKSKGIGITSTIPIWNGKPQMDCSGSVVNGPIWSYRRIGKGVVRWEFYSQGSFYSHYNEGEN